jgi:hypothetical protein
MTLETPVWNVTGGSRVPGIGGICRARQNIASFDALMAKEMLRKTRPSGAPVVRYPWREKNGERFKTDEAKIAPAYHLSKIEGLGRGPVSW